MREQQHEPHRVETTRREGLLVGDFQPRDLFTQALPGGLEGEEDGLHELGTTSLHQCPAGVDARQHRSGRARRVAGLEAPLQAVTVEALRAGAHQARLGVTGEELVDARDHRVGPERHGVRRQLRVVAEMCSPGLVHYHGHVAAVGDFDDACDVGERAEVVRLGDEHGAGIGIGRERGFDVFDGHSEGHARGGVDRRRQPTRLQVRQHHAEKEGPVQRARHDDLVARLADGEAQGLVAVRRAPRRVAAPVGAVPGGGTPLGFRDQAAGPA